MTTSTMTGERISEIVTDAAAVLGCDESDLIGMSLLEVVQAAEREGARIYWGCLPSIDVMASIVVD